MSISGKATAEGTARYRARMNSSTHPEFYRNSNGLWYSNIGLGSYMGHYDESTDKKYIDSIIRAIELGCNVIDTSINYRFQRSERAIGQAIGELIRKDTLRRDEIILSTKGGFIPGDSEPPRNFISYFEENFVRSGIATQDDLVMGCHCISPAYIQNQLDNSLKNLDLDCIDIYYLHNPEIQLEEISRNEFIERIRSVFELLEKNVSEGKIQYYGTATWNGYRINPDLPDHLELKQFIDIADEIAGKQHHFRIIQLPFNLAMPEALLEPTQSWNKKSVPVLQTAMEYGITVMSSASILQGQLAQDLPKHLIDLFGPLETDAQRAIQFVRSAPGITTALVGMSHSRHVDENLFLAKFPPMSSDEFHRSFHGG